MHTVVSSNKYDIFSVSISYTMSALSSEHSNQIDIFVTKQVSLQSSLEILFIAGEVADCVVPLMQHMLSRSYLPLLKDLQFRIEVQPDAENNPRAASDQIRRVLAPTPPHNQDISGLPLLPGTTQDVVQIVLVRLVCETHQEIDLEDELCDEVEFDVICKPTKLS